MSVSYKKINYSRLQQKYALRQYITNTDVVVTRIPQKIALHVFIVNTQCDRDKDSA